MFSIIEKKDVPWHRKVDDTPKGKWRKNNRHPLVDRKAEPDNDLHEFSTTPSAKEANRIDASPDAAGCCVDGSRKAKRKNGPRTGGKRWKLEGIAVTKPVENWVVS